MIPVSRWWNNRYRTCAVTLLLSVVFVSNVCRGQDDTTPNPFEVDPAQGETSDESEAATVEDTESDSSPFDETFDEVTADELIEEFLAPPKDPTPAEIALAVVFYATVFAVIVTIKAVLLWVLRSFLLALPPDHRHFQPNHVWFALIPCFSLVWNFIICNGISQSYRAYFQAQNRQDVGDCGQAIGMLLCASVTATVLSGAIPCIGMCIAPLTGIATLIFLIVYFVQLSGLKTQITPWEQELKW